MHDEIPLDHDDTLYIYTDGASRGNSGESACAYVCATEDDVVFRENQVFLGEATNNKAEYEAIFLALEDAVSIHRGPIVLHSDSRLVVKQINGDWRVKSANLKPIYDEILGKMNRYDDWSLHHVPRDNELIAEADALCNDLLDAKTGKS